MAHTFPALNGPSIQAIQWTTECILQGYINTLLWSIVSRVKPFQIVHSFIETRRTILVIVSPVHSSIRRWCVGKEKRSKQSLLFSSSIHTLQLQLSYTYTSLTNFLSRLLFSMSPFVPCLFFFFLRQHCNYSGDVMCVYGG